MRFAETFCILTATLLLCSCSQGSSSGEGIKEQISQAAELGGTQEDNYACLPDGVRLDDERFVTQLPTDEGDSYYYDRFGMSFSLPEGCGAYLFECDNDEYPDEANHTCEAAIFLTNANFPYSHEYIRLGYFTNIMCFSTPCSYILSNPDSYINKYETVTDYNEELEKEIKRLAPAFKSCEGLDAYDYVNISSSHKEWLDINFLDENANALVNDFTNILPINNVFRTPAPDSSAGEISDEYIELDSGYVGLKLCFETRRNGIDMDKEVYWLLDPNEEGVFSVMRRVEFSKDKGAKWMTEPQQFLNSLELSAPKYLNKDDPIDYFGRNIEEVEE